MGDQDLNPICHACYKCLEFSPVKLVDTSTGCFQVDQHNTKIPKVKMIALPSGSVYLEERLRNTSRVDGGRCCRFHFRRKPDCWKGSSCQFAHDEVDVFNSHDYIKEVCNECLEIALGKLELLQKRVCLEEEHKGRDFPDSFLWCLPLKGGVISICRPISINADEMRRRGFDFVMQHTFLNCFYGVMACYRPHTKVEEDVWNKWNKSGETRMKLHNKGKIFYIELIDKRNKKIEERKLAIASVEERKREENAKQRRLLQEQRALHQVVHNYKKDFNTLLETEMSAITKSIESSLKETFQMKAVPEELVMGSHDHYRLVIMNQEVSEFLEKHVESVHVLVYPRRGTPAHSMQRFNALVHKVHSKGLILQPEPYFRSQMPLPVDCAVSLQLKSEKSQFQFLQRVLNQLKAKIISRVNPNVEKFKLVKRNKSFEAYSKNPFLSVDALFQQNAVQLALNAPHDGPPFLLIGPFGTGKTRLIARMTCEVLMDPTSRVLICTHHNQTADSYIKAYFSKVRNLPCAPVRLVSKTKVDKRQKEGASYFLSNYEMSKEELFENYKKSRLIVTTTMTAYSMHDMNLHFSHIFLDEAAQCTEIEAMIPLSLAGPETKIVLAGDHLQVGPGDSLRSSNSDVVRGGTAPSLATSLLTRLHQLYTKFLKQSEIKNDPRILSYMASLLTNYRCHAGILRVPSNLFYESSLLARAHYELHSEVNSSLCFHCTSLKTQAWSREMQEEEIRIMMNKAYNLFKTWPEEWKKLGESNNSICIMMRTHEQLQLIKKQLSQRECPNFKKAVILRTIYSIQGLEFTAVFLCTTEPYDVVGGNPVPRKQAIGSSIMNKRVFNTVLTRAKALFIAFGNPFYLMNAEGDSDCWREYIKRCTESSSITFQTQPSDDQKLRLCDMVFHFPLQNIDIRPDTFIENYAKEFIQQLECVNEEWKIKVNDYDQNHDLPLEETGELITQGTICILQWKSSTYAEAVSISTPSERFAVQGVNNMNAALDGAKVLVVPFTELYPETEEVSKEHSYRLKCVKVIRVLEQGNQQPILCKIDPLNRNLFIPIRGQGPILANLPPISLKLLQLENTLHQILNKHISLLTIPCFSGPLIKEGIPLLSDTIPIEFVDDLLYLVHIIHWEKGQKYPMAAVVGAFPLARNNIMHENVRKRFSLEEFESIQKGVGGSMIQNLERSITPYTMQSCQQQLLEVQKFFLQLKEQFSWQKSQLQDFVKETEDMLKHSIKSLQDLEKGKINLALQKEVEEKTALLVKYKSIETERDNLRKDYIRSTETQAEIIKEEQELRKKLTSTHKEELEALEIVKNKEITTLKKENKALEEQLATCFLPEHHEVSRNMEAITELLDACKQYMSTSEKIAKKYPKTPLDRSVKGHEDSLEKLCWFPFGIHTLLVEAVGGDFTLDYGDTILEIPQGAFEEDCIIRYGIALHGPWLLPQGYSLCSVTVYLNLLGQQPKRKLILHLSNWYGGSSRDRLRFAIAPHHLITGESKYQFTLLSEGNFSTASNGQLSIVESKCLYTIACEELQDDAKWQIASIQKTLDNSIDKEKLNVLFTVCSNNWSQIMEDLYEVGTSWKLEGRWIPFSFKKKKISAKIDPSEGPGWVADIYGCQDIERAEFQKEFYDGPALKDAVERHLYPPFYPCWVTYKRKELPHMNRIKVVIDGLSRTFDFPLLIKEGHDQNPILPPSTSSMDFDVTAVPLQTPGKTSNLFSNHSAVLPSKRSTRLLESVPSDQDLQKYIVNKCSAKWRSIGTYLNLDSNILEGIRVDTHLPDSQEKLFKVLVTWKKNSNSTWKVLIEALENAEQKSIVEELVKDYQFN